MKIGILGYGYTASFFADLLIQAGYEVWGTSRDASALQQTVPSDVKIIDFNRDHITRLLPETSGLLISTPPDDSGVDPALALLGDTLIENNETLKWVGYLSSTGVYGNHDGRWVDETSSCHPHSSRARSRFTAENAWLSLADEAGLAVVIFRLAGIYGPGRNALQRMKAGKSSTVYKEGQYFSRIHVADIALALMQSLRSPTPGETFNLADDLPCNTCDVDNFAADLLHLDRPEMIPYDKASLSDMAREFYESNRRVSNAKLKRILLSQLQYPSYKEGLRSILSSEMSL